MAAPQHYASKEEMARDLFKVIQDDELSIGSKLAIAEQIFASWSEWWGKITSGGKQKSPNEENSGNPSHGQYWSAKALEQFRSSLPKKDTGFRFEHAVPRSILRASLGLAPESTLNRLKLTKLNFCDSKNLYAFLEKFCIGVVLLEKEQKNLDNPHDKLRSSMGETLNWSDWETNDFNPWLRYEKINKILTDKNEQGDVIIIIDRCNNYAKVDLTTQST
jgi:hypothetical protein